MAMLPSSDKEIMFKIHQSVEGESNVEQTVVDCNDDQHRQDDDGKGSVDGHLESPGSHWNEDGVGKTTSPVLIPIKDIVTSSMDGTRVSDFSIDTVGNTIAEPDDNVNDNRDPITTIGVTPTAETPSIMDSSSSLSRRQDDRTQRRAGRIRNRQQMGTDSFQSEATNRNTSAIEDMDVDRIKEVNPTDEVTSQPHVDTQPDSPTKEGFTSSKTGYSIPLNQPLSTRSDDSTVRRQRRRAERQNRRNNRGGLLTDSTHSADTMSSRNSSFGSLQSNDDGDGFASSEVVPTPVAPPQQQQRQQPQQYSSGVVTIETDKTRCSSPTNVLLSEIEEPKVESPTKLLVSTLEVPRIPSPSNLLMSDLEAPNVPSPTRRLSEHQAWTSVTRNPSTTTTSTPQDDQSVTPPPPPLLSSTPRFVAPIRATSLPVPQEYQLHKRNLGGAAEPGRSMSAQEQQQGHHREEPQQSPGAYFIQGRAIGFRPAWATRQRNSDGQDNGRQQQRRQSRASFWRRRSSAHVNDEDPNGSRGRRRSSLTDFIRGMQQQNNQTSEEMSPTTINRNDDIEPAGSNYTPENDSESPHVTDTRSNFARLGTARSFRRERSRMVVDAACRLLSMRMGLNRTDNTTPGSLGETTANNMGGTGDITTTNNDGTGSPSPSSEKKSSVRLALLLVAVILIAVTVGVTVGVEQKPSKKLIGGIENTTAPVDESDGDGGGFNAIFTPRESALRSKLAYLTADPKAYENIHSPQYYALKWLANDDKISVQENDKQRLEHRFALAVLYLSTSELGWHDANEFLSPLHECNWTASEGMIQGGISCDSSNRITHLRLGGNRLVGTLPQEIRAFSHLELLQLDGNSLEGRLPGFAITKLTKLTSLDIRDNELSSSLPFNIGLLSNLENLLLGMNGLESSLPTTFSLLSKLVNLDLSDNSFSGAIFSLSEPLMGASLSKLQSLNLASNRFRGTITSQISTMSSLQMLNLGNNDIVGSIPNEVSSLTQLSRLLAEGNFLTGTIPWENLPNENLTEIVLNDNFIVGTLPSNIGRFSKLANLRLDNNGITSTIPESIGQLSKLEVFGLGSNELTGQLPTTSFGNMTSLRFVDLRQNSFVGEIPAELGRCSNLKAINLSRNRFNGTLPTELGNLHKLKHLIVNENDLSGPVPFDYLKLTSLISASFSDNMLTGDVGFLCAVVADSICTKGGSFLVNDGLDCTDETCCLCR